MKRRTLPALTASLIAALISAANPAAESGAPILAASLQSLTVPGKVSAVLWTRRQSSCTLQILMPLARPPASSPRITAWLLKADGARIPETLRWETPRPQRGTIGRSVGTEVEYSFPLSASQDAFAAVVSVDDEVRVERLKPFD